MKPQTVIPMYINRANKREQKLNIGSSLWVDLHPYVIYRGSWERVPYPFRGSRLWSEHSMTISPHSKQTRKKSVFFILFSNILYKLDK